MTKQEKDQIQNDIIVAQKCLSNPILTVIATEDTRVILGYSKGTVNMIDGLLERIRERLDDRF